MSWYSLFKVAQTGYGSWMSPSGEEIPVGNQDHFSEGMKILKDRHNIEVNEDSGSKGVYGHLYDMGYVRLVYRNAFSMTFAKVTDSQKRAIGPMISRCGASSYVFESMENYSKDAYCNNRIEVLRALRKI
jgi:hypothetical protein